MYKHHKQKLIQCGTATPDNVCRCNLQEHQSHLSVIRLGIRGAPLSGFRRKEFAETADEIWTGYFQQNHYWQP